MSKYNTNHYYSIDYLSDISCNRIQTNNHQLYSHRFSFSDWLWRQTPDKRVPATVV